ncbi:ParB/RepB/Spo0J family partition protein [Aquabacterium fontiphilum]|uniref:ParB/RepB/Spo0J family partition protein n=1 Tax=Aquabacterium fontiphilum TaxID=450365 RepID=UPI001377DEB9|nr:ParB/RepB/Spo0J family partition protein [Aquabacterium fontiphilum]NBD22086.1 ParB/RepB/Spo0J family partition protein [Aquabacterium fontiphilum]
MNKRVRTTDLAAALDLSNLGSPAAPRPAPPRPRTSVGDMLSERKSTLEAENAELKKRVQAWAGAKPVLELDPAAVVPSRFANRIDFEGIDFARFKEEVRAAGGNVQPIKVVPFPAQPGRYQIVYGHRRHRACAELGLKVRAIVDEGLDEQRQFVEMERENRERKSLSAYEQGVWYLRAMTPRNQLTEGSDLEGWGLFDGLRALADAIGQDPGNVSKACRIARLPAVVLDAFPRRTDIQFNWSTKLARAFERDAAGVIERARRIAAQRAAGRGMDAKQTFSELTFESSAQAEELKPSQVQISLPNGLGLATVITSKEGATSVLFSRELTAQQRDQLVEALAHAFR